MKTVFKIPVTWEVYGTVEIEAESLEDAMTEVYQREDLNPGTIEGHVVEDSFQVEKYAYCKFLNNV